MTDKLDPRSGGSSITLPHPSPAKLIDLFQGIFRMLGNKKKDFVRCVLCGTPIALEDAVIDEWGNGVHSACYVTRLQAMSFQLQARSTDR
ncbi:MAG: hypothetical protein WB919_18800 [Candidatus Sulfotelmatobacter sp.]